MEHNKKDQKLSSADLSIEMRKNNDYWFLEFSYPDKSLLGMANLELEKLHNERSKSQKRKYIGSNTRQKSYSL